MFLLPYLYENSLFSYFYMSKYTKYNLHINQHSFPDTFVQLPEKTAKTSHFSKVNIFSPAAAYIINTKIFMFCNTIFIFSIILHDQNNSLIIPKAISINDDSKVSHSSPPLIRLFIIPPEKESAERAMPV